MSRLSTVNNACEAYYGKEVVWIAGELSSMKCANGCVLYTNGSSMAQCEMEVIQGVDHWGFQVIHGDPMFQRPDL